MNQYLRTIQDLLQQNKNISEADKEALLKTIIDADKQWAITDFKLDRTEKVKKTTAILLEETIAELEQKRKAVEAQNRELEIESSLERIRSVAMGMMKPDDLLNICQTQFNELKQLGFADIRNALIGIYHDDEKYFIDYDYSDFSGGVINKIPYNKNLLVDRTLMQLKSASDAFSEFVVEGKELEEWKQFRKQNGEYDDTRINDIDVLYYYFYSINRGNVGISTFRKINGDQLAILKRFRNVFGLAYQRYVDIEQAEAQAKEAKIEASLERMRAVAMGMRKSEELIAVCESMYRELTALGFTNIRNAQIAIKHDEKQAYLICEYSDFAVNILQEAAYDSSPMVQELYRELGKTSNVLYQREFSGDEFEKWRTWRKSIKDRIDSRIDTADSMCFYLFSMGSGYVGISTFNPITSDQVRILKRFKNVFELSYQRYSDVANAEAQAREAKIEAALERTRTQSMIMQHSKELDNTLRVFHEQVLLLGIHSAFSFLWLPDEEKDRHIFWAAWGEETSAGQAGKSGPTVFKSKAINYSLDRNEAATAQCLVDWKSNETVYSYHVPPVAVEKYFSAWQELIDGVEHLKPEYFSGGLYYVEAFMKYGCFGVMVVTDLTEDEKKVLARFAIEFERTYTRFLDLQKAEVQAREAKIEAALEKVRSRSLAVHQSDEFKEVINIVFEKLQELEIPVESASINIFNEGSKDTDVYACGHTENGMDIRKARLRYFDHPIANDLYDAHKNGLDFFVGSYGIKEKDSYYGYQFEHGDLKELPADIKQRILETERYSLSMAPAKNSVIIINNFDGRLLSETEIDIVKRFAKVFEQAYTRFLDLKKAEAQTRESQIQLALERVRARTMAMQRSDELPEAANLLFQQIQSLGMSAWSAGYCVWDEDKKSVTLWMSSEGVLQPPFKAPLTEDPSFIHFLEAYQRGETFAIEEIGGEELVTHYKYMRTLPVVGEILDKIIEAGFPLPTFQIFHAAYFSRGFLLFITYEPVPQAHDLFKRFAKVFEQTYTRFLDLQKAEAQTRESQIQLALERVRARTMAMQKSGELADTANVLFQQLNELGESPGQMSIGIVNEEEGIIDMWVSMMDNPKNPVYKSPISEPHVIQKNYQAWKKQIKSFVIDLQGKEMEEYMEFRRSYHGIESKDDNKYRRRVIQVAPFSKGMISLSSHEPRPSETLQLLERFAAVFDLTYTRFLDLQRAEAQARESQIEAALERVRSRAMAMQTSEELNALIGTVFAELTRLDLVLTRCVIWIFDTATEGTRWWMANMEEPSNPMNFYLQYHEHKPYIEFLNKWKEKSLKWVYDLKGQTKIDWDKFLFNETELVNLPEVVKKGMAAPERILLSASFNNFGGINVASLEPLSDEHFDILLRFAKVFDLTYTRFNDLKQAEAQAREATIEAALERVRYRAMAMQNSSDVGEATSTMFVELDSLGIETFRCGIAIVKDEELEVWSMGNTGDGRMVKGVGRVNIGQHPLWELFQDSWKKQDDFLFYYLEGKEKEDYVKAITNTASYSMSQSSLHFPDMNFQAYNFEEGGIFTFSLAPHNETDKSVMKRFTNVFSLTFRRYQDLTKAEAQAREGQVEVSLERVRAKAMAMHNSNDLSVSASMVFTELRKLGISPIRCGVGLLNKESHKAQLYSASSSEDGDGLALVGWVQLENHAVLEGIYDAWLQQHDYFPEMQGEQLQSYYRLLLAGLPVRVPDFSTDQKHYGYFIPFSIGCLYAWSNEQYTDDQVKIMRRFGSIIDLTFRRYLELQQSEINAREAVRQAALDRVRADIASMRTIDDLDRITPLIWNELTILGIPFNRCGVFIMDESQRLIHTFLSTPDGKAIAAFHIPYDTPGNINQVLSHWHEKKNYIDHWDENAFTEFANMLARQGGLTSPEQYLKTIPKGGFYLHFLPFLQGMLYVGNTMQVSEDEIKIIQSVADAFSTAYARYEDFNRLEAAKQQVEKTLTDLKQAQTQLVQSEKMASLGELTAGIAHEIQNPLNFVNNFSDVSSELLDEMKDELEKGNYKDAIEIANDVKQNLEKINHHGKRADGIVKGMLQHSRTSSGQKELSDINALADEYLRLAYHGLRAKDKSFNAKFEMDFDPAIPKMNVMPQEIGRVILNLINNAFYAVSQKQKLEDKKYEPTVRVATKKAADKVLISVNDNGQGIPQKILAKIFQPFFTTKPTGQGTGLGLSLSYDIVKAHGGELKVETKEGEGTSFIIYLNANS